MDREETRVSVCNVLSCPEQSVADIQVDSGPWSSSLRSAQASLSFTYVLLSHLQSIDFLFFGLGSGCRLFINFRLDAL